MPIMRCQKDGKSGYKFGPSGTCFTGPGAKEKARKQGAAIKISQQSRSSQIMLEIGVALAQRETTTIQTLYRPTQIK